MRLGRKSRHPHPAGLNQANLALATVAHDPIRHLGAGGSVGGISGLSLVQSHWVPTFPQSSNPTSVVIEPPLLLDAYQGARMN